MPYLEELLDGEQLKKAELQDRVMEIIADSVNGWCFHGGTAIWRCYGGKRFSKDIDMYMKGRKDITKVLNRLRQAGFMVKKDAERRTTGFYTIRNSTDISLQIKIKPESCGIATYTNIDGTMMDVYAISPEGLVLEKIAAYNNRMLERDIYDIKVLAPSVVDKERIAATLEEFLKGIKRPKDEGALRGLVYEGIIPSFDEIVDYLKRWCAA